MNLKKGLIFAALLGAITFMTSEGHTDVMLSPQTACQNNTDCTNKFGQGAYCCNLTIRCQGADCTGCGEGYCWETAYSSQQKKPPTSPRK